MHFYKYTLKTQCIRKNTAANLMEAFTWFEMRIYEGYFGKFYKHHFIPFTEDKNVFILPERFAEDHKLQKD